MTRHLTTTAAAVLLTAAINAPAATPFRIFSPAEMHDDYSVSWADLSTVHGTPVADWTTLDAPGHGPVAVFGYSEADMTLHNNDTDGGLFTPGVLLSNPGPAGISLYPPAPAQAFGVTIEHLQTVQATYTLQIWSPEVELIAQFSVPSPGAAGNPTFIGIVDPDARIGIVSINASPDDRFAITDPLFQSAPPVRDLADLPVAATATLRLRPGKTYLHEGRDPASATPATDDASATFPNTCNLQRDFPGLRAGDILHFERQGVSLTDGTLNKTLGLFSETPVIETGTALRRVPGAIDAGQDIYTPKVSASGTFSNINTPTNIPQDFAVGTSTFLPVPDGARYAFFSLAEPSPTASPVEITLSHIPRTQFLDWLASFGLNGPLAELDHDLDGDGLTLIEEFALLKDPTTHDAGTAAETDYLFPARLGPDNGSGLPLSIVFGTRSDAPLRYRAQFSSDLATWHDAPDGTVRPIASTGDGRTVYRADDPAAPGARRFGRITVELIPPPSF